MLAGAQVSPEQPQEDIQTVKSRTDRPFGANFLLALPKPGDEEAVATQRFLNRFREELDKQCICYQDLLVRRA